MRHLVVIFVIALVVAGCSKPQDIIFGPEPLKQISEQGEQFKKLSEEDRTLLVGYLTITEMGKVLGAEVKPTAGRTVGEVLADARAWKEKMKVAGAEAKASKVKVLAERKAVTDRILSSVAVTVIDKMVIPKNYEAGYFSEMLGIRYTIENKTAKAIRQLKGHIVFKDAIGDEIGRLRVDFNEPVDAGKSLTSSTGRGWEIYPSSNSKIEKIAGREFSSMKASFEPESIAFEGGEVLKAPN